MALRRDALFEDGEQRQFNAALVDMTVRCSYEQDPEKYIADHRRLGCRVWHRGQLLVHGEGFAPDAIVRERRR